MYMYMNNVYTIHLKKNIYIYIYIHTHLDKASCSKGVLDRNPPKVKIVSHISKAPRYFKSESKSLSKYHHITLHRHNCMCKVKVQVGF